MPTFSIIFAYNSTTSIPSPGSQRVTYGVAYARFFSRKITKRHELIDQGEVEDVIGRRLLLQFHLGRQILKNPSDRTFFRAFFEAKHRWAVFGDFKDTANSANDNLCKCLPLEEEEIHITAERDVDGFILISEKTF